MTIPVRLNDPRIQPGAYVRPRAAVVLYEVMEVNRDAAKIVLENCKTGDVATLTAWHVLHNFELVRAAPTVDQLLADLDSVAVAGAA